MISLPLQGHIIPFVNLAIKIASKGFSVTFAHHEFVHHHISNSQYNSTDVDIFAQARSSGLDINYTTISDGFPIEFDRSADSDTYMESYFSRFPEKVDELVGKIVRSRSSSGSNFFLISDTFSLWPAKIAEKYGLVDVSSGRSLQAISALQEKQPFYAIGPLFQGDFKNSLVARSLLPESNCTEWLNSRPAGSVLYISFGSLAKTDKNAILEIAGGILLSQNQVLLNPATGGFLTHCGWNSIVESIWSGVPMICHPLFTDQITNRKLVVDDWKVGIDLCDGASVTREEVAEKIGALMSGKRADELRQEIKKVRETLQNALMEDGSSEKNFDSFVEDVKAEIERRCLDIRYTTISDGFPQDYDRILNFNEYWEAILRDFPSCVHEFVGRIIQSTDESSVPFLVADTFYSWPATIAEEYNILNVSFWTEPALDVDITTVTHQIVFKAFDQLTYAIGPINFSTDFTKTIVPKSLWSETDCTEWLNSKPAGSVLYISFGSIAQSSKQLAEEIANGLLLSEVNFVWVLRENTDVLPDGFKNEVRGRGLIVSWCNQNSVLSSPATGGFLTHCGWNSILESISCGVPMICFPFYADQPTNRKLVVDDWKVGINLCDGSSVDRKEVAEKIKQLMSGEISNGLRGEMKKIRTIVQKALAEGGSTRRNFDQFLKDLRAKVHGRSQDISTS
ncbi:UNVERIFIED_CONTAM: UDP-glycosyltransferase 86A1 [Sesamum calycinum]|uniref:UDP-glycosyltransferase 86A1 n=1 Tax=Sesamum calycinum TaxID=2727403 RepID=A0AAW2NXA6_9LAMI